MRTTLTLDDDLADVLERRRRKTGQPFKQVVNAALRQGLKEELQPSPVKVVTRPSALGLRPGIDSKRMNQLVDDLEVDAFLSKHKGAVP